MQENSEFHAEKWRRAVGLPVKLITKLFRIYQGEDTAFLGYMQSHLKYPLFR